MITHSTSISALKSTKPPPRSFERPNFTVSAPHVSLGLSDQNWTVRAAAALQYDECLSVEQLNLILLDPRKEVRQNVIINPNTTLTSQQIDVLLKCERQEDVLTACVENRNNTINFDQFKHIVSSKFASTIVTLALRDDLPLSPEHIDFLWGQRLSASLVAALRTFMRRDDFILNRQMFEEGLDGLLDDAPHVLFATLCNFDHSISSTQISAIYAHTPHKRLLQVTTALLSRPDISLSHLPPNCLEHLVNLNDIKTHEAHRLQAHLLIASQSDFSPTKQQLQTGLDSSNDAIRSAYQTIERRQLQHQLFEQIPLTAPSTRKPLQL
jgi:hypothetical protein